MHRIITIKVWFMGWAPDRYIYQDTLKTMKLEDKGSTGERGGGGRCVTHGLMSYMYTERFGMTPEGHFLTSESIHIIMIIKNIYHIW